MCCVLLIYCPDGGDRYSFAKIDSDLPGSCPAQCATPMEAFGKYHRKTIVVENKKKDEIHLPCVTENILNLQL